MSQIKEATELLNQQGRNKSEKILSVRSIKIPRKEASDTDE